MTSADSSHFDFLGVTLCEASWDKSLLFPVTRDFHPGTTVHLFGLYLLLASSPVQRLGIHISYPWGYDFAITSFTLRP